MNVYKCFYAGASIEVIAPTSYQAQQKAAVLLKVRPKNRHMISVVLVATGGEAVIHSTSSIG